MSICQEVCESIFVADYIKLIICIRRHVGVAVFFDGDFFLSLSNSE